MSTSNSDLLPEGCFQYEHPSQVPKKDIKYWYRRHDLFKKWDDGIWMTERGWYEVTPEDVADKIAVHITQAAPKKRTAFIDAFAGLGGNIIAVAKLGHFDRMFAVEKDKNTLECAKHNAEIYGVKNKIFWINADIFDIIGTRFACLTEEAVVFASPPWGGPAYSKQTIFDLSSMRPYNLATLHAAFKPFNSMVLFLPRNSDEDQLADLVDQASGIDVVHYCTNQRSKALCAFYGTFKQISRGQQASEQSQDVEMVKEDGAGAVHTGTRIVFDD